MDCHFLGTHVKQVWGYHRVPERDKSTSVHIQISHEPIFPRVVFQSLQIHRRQANAANRGVSASVPHWWKFYPHHANRGNVQTNLGRLPLVLAALQSSHDDTLQRVWLAAGNPQCDLTQAAGTRQGRLTDASTVNPAVRMSKCSSA